MIYYLKIFFLASSLLFHGLLSALGKLIFFFNKRLRIHYIANINRVLFFLFSLIIGVHVTVKQKPKCHKKAVLYVGNHLTYLDILTIGTCYPTVFVTSVDMGERKSEGWLTSNAASIYVERRRDKLTLNEIKKNIENMRSVISKNCPVCIFPEATSANGSPELVFYSPLFASVEYTDTLIVPFAITYTSVNREALTKENEGIIYFYRGERFIPHVKRLLKSGHIKVEISVLPGFSAKDKNRKAICLECKTMIEEALKQ